MLTITPCLDKSIVSSYCKKCRQVYSAALYLYIAEDRGQSLGAALFEIGGDRVRIVYYEAADPADAFLFDGIMRAGLNYASQQGLANGLIPEDFRYTHRELFAKLNYPVQPLFDITNFFSKYKNCGNL